MAGITITADSSTQFETGAAEYNSTCRLDDNTFVVAYRDENDFNYGKALVGTRSGTVITISEANAVAFSAFDTTDITVRALSATKIVISYYRTSNSTVYGIVGTVSGTTITFGTAVVIDATPNGTITVAVIDSSNVVFSICNASDDDLDCYVASISGTTISAGSVQTFLSANPLDGTQIASIGLNSTHCAIAWIEDGGNDLYALIAEVNTGAQTITFGAKLEIATVLPFSPNATFIDKFDSTHFIAAAVSNTDFSVVACSYNSSTLAITGGTAIEITDVGTVVTNHFSLCTMGSYNFLVAYYIATGTQGEVRSGTLSGSVDLAWDAQGAQIFDNSTTAFPALCRLTDNYFLLGYKKG